MYKEFLSHLGNGEFPAIGGSMKTYGNLFVPYVIEKRAMVRGIMIYFRLLKDRIIFIGSAIEDTLSALVIAQILFLRMRTKIEISIYINSPRVVPLRRVWRFMILIQFVQCDVCHLLYKVMLIVWQLSSLLAEQRERDMVYPTPVLCSINHGVG